MDDNKIFNNWEVVQFKEYLTDKDGNEDAIRKLFKVEKGLLKAPTGAGKTYSLIEIAKKEAKETGKKIIFAVPKKKQAEQIEKEYKIPCVTGDTKIINNDSRVIACVYDSIEKVFALKDWIINKDTIVIVDECHRMRYDSTFRHKALNRIKRVIERTNYIFISATTRVIEDIDFNYKINCITEEVNYNYGACYLCDYNGALIESVIQVINVMSRKNPKTGKRSKILLFLENKDTLQKIKTFLETAYGYKVAVLTSETKEEKAMKTLVETSKLEGFDIYLTTSVIEEGINIKNKELFTCIYTLDSVNPCYDSLEQACARLRTKNHISIIMRKNHDKTPNADELTEDIIKQYEEAKAKLEKVNFMYELAKETGLEFPKEEYAKCISAHGHYIYNGELNKWVLDEDRYLRYKELRKNKAIAGNKVAHKREVEKRVKAKEFKYLTILDDLGQEDKDRYKEITKEFKEEKEARIKMLLEAFADMTEEGKETLYDALESNSIGIKGVPVREEEKNLIKAIREHREVSRLFKELTRYGLDIEEMVINNVKDYKLIRRSTIKHKYKKYNLVALSGLSEMLGVADDEATQYIKIRTALDELRGKELKKAQLLKIYKIKNPNCKATVKTFTDEQQTKAIELIEDIYKVYTKKNKQVKLGNLL